MSTAPNQLRRVDGLWFADGNLVIQAEDTVFRVYGHFLGQHSAIFSDMLALPPSLNTESYEGCPLVRLPDSAEDALHFLKALFDYDYFAPRPAFPIVASILRMSHKYEVAPLLQRAIRHLSDQLPTTLKEFRAPQDFEPDPQSVIPLARRLGLDWVIPAAFYHLCSSTSSASAILSSVLDDGDKAAYFDGRRILELWESSRILDWLWQPPSIQGCASPEQCKAERISVRRYIECVNDTRANATTDSVLPLEVWAEFYWYLPTTPCSICRAYMRTAHQKALEDFWDRLPGTFGLPDWEVLREMRDAALTRPTQ
ncbi:BTB domain-containing protein [Mycena kentingensis (nom. inval.)]|nr:BTB domain-containing protein [Mycena kentingensis (nom. inval.)]